MATENELDKKTDIAFVIRAGTKCTQYCFTTIEDLDLWTKRYPYKNEMLKVFPISNDASYRDRWLKPTEVVEYVRLAHSSKPFISTSTQHSEIDKQNYHEMDTMKPEDRFLEDSITIEEIENLDREWKLQPIAMPGWPLDGIPVKRTKGMIYWYYWNNKNFDIRLIRQILNLSEEHPDDNWFKFTKRDPNGSFKRIMLQLQNALGDRKFCDIMAKHDQLIAIDQFESKLRSRKLNSDNGALPM